jgi:hypothetical protein
MFLKQSTAYTFRFGPFLDDGDGKTAETGLTIEDSHVRVSKAGANFIDKAETSNSAHDEAGFYVVVLNATDTNTVGELQIACHISGALPVFKTFYVVEEAIYDAMFAASADLITKVDAIDTVVDAILVDTGTTLDGKINTIDGIVDAILVDTAEIGSAGAGLTAVPWNSSWDAEVQSEVADGLAAYDPPTKAEMDAMWTTAQTEAYASNGSTATPAQLLYMIYACVGSFSISSDKITALKLDRSTQAMRFDMDSSSDPTYRKRDA